MTLIERLGLATPGAVMFVAGLIAYTTFEPGTVGHVWGFSGGVIGILAAFGGAYLPSIFSAAGREPTVSKFETRVFGPRASFDTGDALLPIYERRKEVPGAVDVEMAKEAYVEGYVEDEQELEEMLDAAMSSDGEEESQLRGHMDGVETNAIDISDLSKISDSGSECPKKESEK